MDDLKFMALAIEKTREGIAVGQSPFGSVIARAGKVISCAHNTVWKDTDPTAHAEVNAIRAAARSLGTLDLSGCTLFSTCEPCPMCLAATHWARIDRVVYGATIADAQGAGFNELDMSASELAKRGGSHLKVQGGVCQQECAALFRLFLDTHGKTY